MLHFEDDWLDFDKIWNGGIYIKWLSTSFSDSCIINCRLGLMLSQPFNADLGALYGLSVLHMPQASVHCTVVNAFMVMSEVKLTL